MIEDAIIKKITKECKKLMYSRECIISDDSLASTKRRLGELYNEYGYVPVLSVLSQIWSFEKAVLYYEKDYYAPCSREIKTVATSYHSTFNGGVERVNAELMELWVRMGLRVVLFTETPESDSDYPYPSSVKRIIIPPFSDMENRLSAVEKHLFAEQIDCFVNHDWTELGSLWECVLAKKLGIPYIQYCHGHFSWCLDYGYPFFYQPRFFKFCDIVVALSEISAKFFQICGCRTVLANNPVPSDLLKVTDPSELNSKNVVMIGRVSKEKYPVEALRIFKIVHDKIPEARFDIVGDGDMLEVAKQFVLDNHLESSVLFHGNKGIMELADYYRNASCVLFTSKMEGYPMTVLETKAYGLPLVMYSLPYLSLVKDGKGVLSSSVGDINSMANNIIKLMEDDEFRKKKGKESRESFNSFVSYDLRMVWEFIFESCEGVINDRMGIFYDPSKVDDDDKQLIPVILDKINRGQALIRIKYEESREYRLGKLALMIPRFIKKFFVSIFVRKL